MFLQWNSSTGSSSVSGSILQKYGTSFISSNSSIIKSGRRIKPSLKTLAYVTKIRVIVCNED